MIGLDLSLTDDIILTKEIDCALQELDLLLSTENTELLGDTSYGVNMEQFLWEMTPSENEVRTYLYSKLNSTYYVAKYLKNIEVKWMDGTYRGMYYVTITLNNPEGDSESNKEHIKVYQYR